jgi:hypothetical protein
MTAVLLVLRRFAGMLAISAIVWTLAGLAYATLVGVPAAAVLRPSAINLAVVMTVCLVAALPRNNR